MSNECMQTLETLGFQADSSAIPRPNYSWERNLKDWKTTPQEPYYPSVDDYRIPDTNKRSLKILEIPMSMTRISLPGDTVKMLRYIDPAYDTDVFSHALQQLNGDGTDVFIMHPYEILLSMDDHLGF